MKFWGTSALVPLLIDQGTSTMVDVLAQEDPDKAFWWGSRVECVSALARLEREGVASKELTVAFLELENLFAGGTEIQPSESVRTIAARLLRVHPLRAADALQLAAAIQASEGNPASLPFVCTDARLALAASKEGFSILP